MCVVFVLFAVCFSCVKTIQNNYCSKAGALPGRGGAARRMGLEEGKGELHGACVTIAPYITYVYINIYIYIYVYGYSYAYC